MTKTIHDRMTPEEREKWDNLRVLENKFYFLYEEMKGIFDIEYAQRVNEEYGYDWYVLNDCYEGLARARKYVKAFEKMMEVKYND